MRSYAYGPAVCGLSGAWLAFNHLAMCMLYRGTGTTDIRLMGKG